MPQPPASAHSVSPVDFPFAITRIPEPLESAFEIEGRVPVQGRDPRKRDAWFAREKSTGLRVKLTIAAKREGTAVALEDDPVAQRLCELGAFSRQPSFPEGLQPIREVIEATDFLAYTEEILPRIALSDLLRARTAAKRPMGFSEAVLFLRPIAEALDFLLQNGRETVFLQCEELWLTGAQLAAVPEAPENAVRPLPQWEELHVFFSMVCLPPQSRAAEPGRSDGLGERTVSGSLQWSDADLHPVPSFTRLVYRVLNGSEVAAAARFTPHAYVPTVALGAVANNLLRDLMCRRKPWALVTPVLRELCANQGVMLRTKAASLDGAAGPFDPPPTPRDSSARWGEPQAESPVAPAEQPPQGAAVTIPKRFLDCVHSADKLVLEPLTETARGIHLVARDEFRIGRARNASDHLAWFWPRDGEADVRTKRISRNGHVRLVRHGGKILIFDNASTQGASWNGAPVPVAAAGEFVPDSLQTNVQPALLNARGILTLAYDYQLELVLTLGVGRPRVSNEEQWEGPPIESREPAGAVRIVPLNSEPALFRAAWIFTDAVFGSGRDSALPLDVPDLAEAAGRFRFYRGQFWLESFQGDSMVEVDGFSVTFGDIIPLRPRQVVRLGSVEYRIALG